MSIVPLQVNVIRSTLAIHIVNVYFNTTVSYRLTIEVGEFSPFYGHKAIADVLPVLNPTDFIVLLIVEKATDIARADTGMVEFKIPVGIRVNGEYGFVTTGQLQGFFNKTDFTIGNAFSGYRVVHPTLYGNVLAVFGAGSHKPSNKQQFNTIFQHSQYHSQLQ